MRSSRRLLLTSNPPLRSSARSRIVLGSSHYPLLRRLAHDDDGGVVHVQPCRSATRASSPHLHQQQQQLRHFAAAAAAANTETKLKGSNPSSLSSSISPKEEADNGNSKYCNFNETVTAKHCIAKYGHINSGHIAAVSFNDDGSVSIVSAPAADATNPAGTGSPSFAAEEVSESASSVNVGEAQLNLPSPPPSLPSSTLRPAVIRIGGRVVSVRDMGKVVFVTVRSDGELIQLAANVTEAFYPTKQRLKEAITDVLNTGDLVGAEGTVGRTKKGELTVFVRNISVLAPYVCADMSVCPDSRRFVVGGGSGVRCPREMAAAAASAAVTTSSNAPKKGAEATAESAPALSKSQLKKLKKKEQKAQQQQQQATPSAADAADGADAAAAKEEEVAKAPANTAQPSSSTISPAAATSPSPPPLATAAAPNAINDPDLRYRYRFMDLVARPQGLNVFRLRHKVIASLRAFLDAKDFTEVETPMFHTVPCGANARPFMTHHNSNNSDLYLRIAPELYLKQCVVGGLERVYEIGKVFRNEDTDKSHNPEFTSCEFYAAYKNYVDLMGWTEELLRHIAKQSTGSTVIRLPQQTAVGESGGESTTTTTTYVEIDLAKPFKRVSVLDEIERKTGVMFPPIHELNSSFGIAFMAALMLKHDIQPPTVRTPAKFLDKLIDYFVTDNTTEPIFVCDHPLFMSPLAKEHEWQNNNKKASENDASKNHQSSAVDAFTYAASSTANNTDDEAQQASHLAEELGLLFNNASENTNGASASSSSLLASFATRSSAPTHHQQQTPSFPLFSVRHGTRGLSERFELFINGMEVCNAYSELCDPCEQLRRFEQQLQAKEQGDDEAMELDETFLKALQVGLPPTAGWGMGIDRLVMLLSGQPSIRDVILFPLLKPQRDLVNRRRSKTAGFFGFNQNMTLFALSSLEAELKRRGDRAGCEQLLQTKKIVQQAGKNPEQQRRQLMQELENGLAMQRQQFYWLHGGDDEEKIVFGNQKQKKQQPLSISNDHASIDTAIWPPNSAASLTRLMGFSSAPPPSTHHHHNDGEVGDAMTKKPKTYVTTASISSSSSTGTHTTTTTTTTTTTINAHDGGAEGANGSSSSSSAVSASEGGASVVNGNGIDNATATIAASQRQHAYLHHTTVDAWSRWRRMAYRHNPFWKFMVRCCGGRNPQE